MVVATGAQAVESSVRATTKTPVDTVWQKVGDFCGIAVWGGGIAHCELSADHKQRTLTLGNGAKVIEELVRWSDKHHSYTYRIVSSPLPVDHYESTLRVRAEHADPDDASDDFRNHVWHKKDGPKKCPPG